MSDSRILSVKPIIHYPRVAQVGKTYLMTIDLEVEAGAEWQYEEEEYPIYCTVDSELFSSKPVGEPVVVLHRFGGSYGESRFLLTATSSQETIKVGSITIQLNNKFGFLLKVLKISEIEVRSRIFHQSMIIEEGNILEEFNSYVSDLIPEDMRSMGEKLRDFLRQIQYRTNLTGNAAVNALEDLARNQLIVRTFEKKYLKCQALECRSAKSTGTPQYDGIFVSLLEKVFVDLGLDGNVQQAGYGKNKREDLSLPGDGDRLQIWDLLKRAEKQPELRRIAILAWGGYGKTTLMRHVAYIYSNDKQQRGLEQKIPVLMILGRYWELLSGENPPDLATFIQKHYIRDLPGGEDLMVPENWAQSVLKGGRAVVIWDGFDEIPKAMRSGLVKWMNEQTQRYPKSIFILTSRPKSYREQDPETFAFPMAYWVHEFDDGQQRDFIDRWYLCQEVFAHGGLNNAVVKQRAKRAADDLYTQIDQCQELKDMGKNPLFLTMMTTFHRRNNGADLPRRRVELYQEICRLQLKDRPKARDLDTVLLNCDAQELLQSLALEMMQRRSRLFKKDAVLANLEKTLMAKSEKIDVADFLEQVASVGELLMRKEDKYEFTHLSFQEYLAAIEIVRTQQEELLYEHLNASGEFADSWSRLMLLYVDLVNPTNLIRQAINQGRTDLAVQMYRETTKQIDPALKAELERRL